MVCLDKAKEFRSESCRTESSQLIQRISRRRLDSVQIDAGIMQMVCLEKNENVLVTEASLARREGPHLCESLDVLFAFLIARSKYLAAMMNFAPGKVVHISTLTEVGRVFAWGTFRDLCGPIGLVKPGGPVVHTLI